MNQIEQLEAKIESIHRERQADLIRFAPIPTRATARRKAGSTTATPATTTRPLRKIWKLSPGSVWPDTKEKMLGKWTKDNQLGWLYEYADSEPYRDELPDARSMRGFLDALDGD